jgi:hypothetical protein
MGLRRIDDKPIVITKGLCTHKEHNPPTHVTLPPGTYEHDCPGCERRTIFTVDPKNRFG